jgi:demethylmenaquinone methyltransferase/2-methoxy-6-polyprenyl-1,4-benzoquinol methylase
MALVTAGRWQKAHAAIASRIKAGQNVLDLGCGTGALAVLLAGRGAQVTGVDISRAMLAQAKQRVREADAGQRIILRELGAVDVDTGFEDGSFDVVVSSLLFSELSDEEIEYVLAECKRVLAPGGRLMVADEVLPGSVLGNLATYLLRLPFAVAAYALTQSTTHRVAGLPGKIERAGFELVETESWLAGTLQLFVSRSVP